MELRVRLSMSQNSLWEQCGDSGQFYHFFHKLKKHKVRKRYYFVSILKPFRKCFYQVFSNHDSAVQRVLSFLCVIKPSSITTLYNITNNCHVSKMRLLHDISLILTKRAASMMMVVSHTVFSHIQMGQKSA